MFVRRTWPHVSDTSHKQRTRTHFAAAKPAKHCNAEPCAAIDGDFNCVARREAGSGPIGLSTAARACLIDCCVRTPHLTNLAVAPILSEAGPQRSLPMPSRT